MKIQRGLPEIYKKDAVKLYLNTFSGKFIPVLGEGPEILKLIESSINSNQCFISEEDGNLLGFVSYQTGKDSFFSQSFSEIVSVYGFLSSIPKVFLLSLLEHHTAAGECYIESIAVTENARGMGIGTRLVETLSGFARDQGYQSLTLQVINTNQKAEALYRRLGFEENGRENFKLFSRIAGWDFTQTLFMRRLLNAKISDYRNKNESDD